MKIDFLIRPHRPYFTASLIAREKIERDPRSNQFKVHEVMSPGSPVKFRSAPLGHACRPAVPFIQQYFAARRASKARPGCLSPFRAMGCRSWKFLPTLALALALAAPLRCLAGQTPFPSMQCPHPDMSEMRGTVPYKLVTDDHKSFEEALEACYAFSSRLAMVKTTDDAKSIVYFRGKSRHEWERKKVLVMYFKQELSYYFKIIELFSKSKYFLFTTTFVTPST